MTQSQLNSILSIEDDSAYIMYVGDDHIEYFVDVLPAEWKVVRTLLDVTPAVERRSLLCTLFIIDARILTKSGYIGGFGLEYSNQTMNTVVQRYSDGQQVLGNMIWNSEDETFTVQYSNGTEYNPLGT